MDEAASVEQFLWVEEPQLNMDDLENDLNLFEGVGHDNEDDTDDDSFHSSSRKEGTSFKLPQVQPICQKTLHESGFHRVSDCVWSSSEKPCFITAIQRAVLENQH
ncbi:hypothetical protein OJAV_G00228740 [Oryzias javanicus]|uniref:Uncharacterized protein n=1 Tax=Oryzias javanicus TaxID=123683 RepID=A0A3S2NT34_ORYJA|nr:hypothetical protein OJAV_G00228740 [Oryzias javanicus]